MTKPFILVLCLTLTGCAGIVQTGMQVESAKKSLVKNTLGLNDAQAEWVLARQRR